MKIGGPGRAMPSTGVETPLIFHRFGCYFFFFFFFSSDKELSSTGSLPKVPVYRLGGRLSVSGQQVQSRGIEL